MADITVTVVLTGVDKAIAANVMKNYIKRGLYELDGTADFSWETSVDGEVLDSGFIPNKGRP